MIHFEINPEFSDHLNIHLLNKQISSSLSYLNISEDESDLSIVITDSDHISSLNKQYRGISSPTDVLSFPSHNVDPGTGMMYIGDIILSYPYVENQAKSKQVNMEDEITMLIVHGILHLIGFDHDNEAQQSKMWDKKKEILNHLGIDINIIPD